MLWYTPTSSTPERGSLGKFSLSAGTGVLLLVERNGPDSSRQSSEGIQEELQGMVRRQKRDTCHRMAPLDYLGETCLTSRVCLFSPAPRGPISKTRQMSRFKREKGATTRRGHHNGTCAPLCATNLAHRAVYGIDRTERFSFSSLAVRVIG